MADPDLISIAFNRAQTELVIQTADLPLGTLADMVEAGSIDLAPGFQRRERWDQESQSHLIESFLLNVPVPPIYLAEEVDGTYTAIDGKQRLRAISDFIYDRLALRNLDQLSHAEGSRFSDLPRDVANALRLRPYLRVVTLLRQTNERLKYEVFLRLNRGGESLNPQEIRNVAFRGAMNDVIYRCSENEFLRSSLKITSDKSEAFRQMQDAEYVLRFLALWSGLDDFRGSLTNAMDQFMIDSLDFDSVKSMRLGSVFDRSIAACRLLWQEQAFRRPDGEGWRDQTLAGMYDAQMLSVAKLTPDRTAHLANRTREIVAATRLLFEDPEFDKAVRTGTNTPARIRYRVDKMSEMLAAH